MLSVIFSFTWALFPKSRWHVSFAILALRHNCPTRLTPSRLPSAASRRTDVGTAARHSLENALAASDFDRLRIAGCDEPLHLRISRGSPCDVTRTTGWVSPTLTERNTCWHDDEIGRAILICPWYASSADTDALFRWIGRVAQSSCSAAHLSGNVGSSKEVDNTATYGTEMSSFCSRIFNQLDMRHMYESCVKKYN